MKDTGDIGMPSSAKELLAIFETNDGDGVTRRGRLILALTHYDEYVVSMQYRSEGEPWDKSWSQGHYFDDNLNAARVYFLLRALDDLSDLPTCDHDRELASRVFGRLGEALP